MTLYTRDENELFGEQPGYAYAGNLVHTATGNFVRRETDLPMADPLVSWHRTYNTRKAEDSGLGPGWTHSHSARLEFPDPDRILLHGTCGRVLTFRRREDDTFERPQDLAADLYTAPEDRYELRFFPGETWTFDASGEWTEIAADGRTATLCHEDGRLTRVEQSAGRSLSLDHDDHGRIVSVHTNDGRSVCYAYDGDTLSRATLPGGAATRYDTDSASRIVRVTDADDVVVVVNEYDDEGRVTRQESPGAGALRFDHDADHGRTTVTHEPSDTQSVYAHNEDARPVRVTDALGHSSTIEYGPDGLLTAAELPGGTVLERVYNEDGNGVDVGARG